MPGPAGAWAGLSYRFEQPGTPAPPATVLTLGYRIDSLAAVMFMMVTFIATMIHIFSIGYSTSKRAGGDCRGSPGAYRIRPLAPAQALRPIFLFLSLFCFSMLNLVLADNLFQVFSAGNWSASVVSPRWLPTSGEVPRMPQ